MTCGGGAVAAVFQVVHCHVEPSSRKVRVSFGIPWCCFKVNLKLFPWSEIPFEFTGVYHTYCLAWELHSWQDSGRETTQKDHCKRANCWSETVAVRGNEGERESVAWACPAYLGVLNLEQCSVGVEPALPRGQAVPYPGISLLSSDSQ